MLIFHAAERGAPELQSFRLSVFHPSEHIDDMVETPEEAGAHAQTIVRQYEDNAVFYALLEQEMPALMDYIRLLHRQYRKSLYQLLAHEFTDGFRDGCLLLQQGVVPENRVDVAAIQQENADADCDLEKARERANHTTHAVALSCMIDGRPEEIQAVIGTIRQFARMCGMK